MSKPAPYLYVHFAETRRNTLSPMCTSALAIIRNLSREKEYLHRWIPTLACDTSLAPHVTVDKFRNHERQITSQGIFHCPCSPPAASMS